MSEERTQTGTVDLLKLAEVVNEAAAHDASVLVSVTEGDPPQVTVRTSLYLGPSVEVEFGAKP